MPLEEQVEHFTRLADEAFRLMREELDTLEEVVRRRALLRLTGIGASLYGDNGFRRSPNSARLEGLDEAADWLVYTVQRMYGMELAATAGIDPELMSDEELREIIDSRARAHPRSTLPATR
jgi:hypothetical protein